MFGGPERVVDSLLSRSAGVTVDDVSASRDSVIRLCSRLTGRADVAEDLAQETLLLAWRQETALRDPDKRQQWVLGIARNLCLRWRREQGRQRSHIAIHRTDDMLIGHSIEELPEAKIDLEVELERHELAELLDRAMALLPDETRDVLVHSYIEELPHSEIGQRLSLSEHAVKARLHRGRIALRRVFTRELGAEAAAYGLLDGNSGSWQETRIWCPQCGAQRLLVRFSEPPGPISFRCPGCEPGPEIPALEVRLANAYFARLVGGLSRPKAILNRVYPWSHEYFSRALAERGSRCTNCGRCVRVQVVADEWAPPGAQYKSRLYVACEACGEAVSASFEGQVLVLPQVQRFWREHPRMRTLPAHLVDAGGRAAVVTSFEAVNGGARLDIVSDLDTLRVLDVRGGVSEPRE